MVILGTMLGGSLGKRGSKVSGMVTLSDTSPASWPPLIYTATMRNLYRSPTKKLHADQSEDDGFVPTICVTAKMYWTQNLPSASSGRKEGLSEGMITLSCLPIILLFTSKFLNVLHQT